MISVVYFGSHYFSADILEAFIKSGLFDIKLVITQPDRPVGRKQEMQMSRVKEIAIKYNLKIDQPETLKNYTVPVEADVNVVCKYGLLIPETILYAPKYHSINVHASLLPKYRGASPIQSALIFGEKETGVTIMKMDKELDHGAIISQRTVEIKPEDTCRELSERLAPVEAELLIDTLPKYVSGEIKAIEQNHSAATLCREFKREDGEIKWDKTATETYNLYRGLTPWPGIWAFWQGKRVKLLDIQPSTENVSKGQFLTKNDRLLVGCADNKAIEIKNLQLEGKKPMTAKEFINGFSKLLI